MLKVGGDVSEVGGDVSEWMATCRGLVATCRICIFILSIHVTMFMLNEMAKLRTL